MISMKGRNIKIFNNKRNIVKISSLFIVLITAFFIRVSFSRYVSNKNININSVSGNMKCLINIDSKSSYIENNKAYFLVTVTNYDGDIISGVDVDYKLTISNKNGSNGVYYYIDSDGNKSSSSDEYVSSLTTPVYSFKHDKKYETQFKVFVKNTSGLKEKVDFNVDLDAVQKENS